MRLVFISDTHSQLEKIQIPEGDILVHCGDLTNRGGLRETVRELGILNSLRGQFRHVILVAGNHDWLFYMDRTVARSLLGEIKYLEDDEIEVEGLRIYGSPWTPEFMGWAFMLPRGERIKTRWDRIPDGLDVLVTHGPPYAILDQNELGVSVGCMDLLEKLEHMTGPPKIHAFGHIHEAHGERQGPGLRSDFINASICNERYQPVNKPIVREL